MDVSRFCISDSSPMSQRNFPPSFWNSNYMYQTGSSAGAAALASFGAAHSHGHPELSYAAAAAAAADPYHHTAGTLHGIHQSDPWHYPLTSQSPYPHSHPHRPMHDLAYSTMTSMPSTSRFNPQYSSLLLQPPVRSTRLGPVATQCTTLGKPTDAWSTPRYHEHLGTDISHLDAANYGSGHTYASMSAMPGKKGGREGKSYLSLSS